MAKKELSLSKIKSLPPHFFLRLIKRMKNKLKDNDTMQKIFDAHDADIALLEYIPMAFKDLDCSAKTDHGIIYFNYKLLADADFEKDYSYCIHEVTHYLDQCFNAKPTKSSDDGEYLHNPYEQKAFTNQVEYIADQYGEPEAESYVENLLEHHDIDKAKEKKELKSVFMEKV